VRFSIFGFLSVLGAIATANADQSLVFLPGHSLVIARAKNGAPVAATGDPRILQDRDLAVRAEQLWSLHQHCLEQHEDEHSLACRRWLAVGAVLYGTYPVDAIIQK